MFQQKKLEEFRVVLVRNLRSTNGEKETQHFPKLTNGIQNISTSTYTTGKVDIYNSKVLARIVVVAERLQSL